ncbi:hypothetical protein, variant 3 [Aphanomyces astaci]|uniref:Uncharacterized protein n=1 Tax=Aphanomyces astaci TaxID=112090 RepID=W4H7F1_APHAT|nr:hypothetical protein, variant 2 [Aphanomyces astaci]XP_009824017.1 hypothetical protein, variant 3 [Aphanomyces astaci]ETV87218.1 hypothetical protein, variant 2 [Aphanomyces astaci]ETV87219.1 hypothetical protein, variant 3 [Aphanomyces astaci]|eukprot:XP_009824016.1 hypothetical protein, variant 2 [Aphanomyces astaci]
MHTNWHSDDSDAASWMDEQGSEGHSSSLTHQPFLLHPNATPSQQRDANDDIAEAIQSIQFDMELWHDMYAVSAPYISPSQQDAWKAIVTQMQQVSHRIIGGGHDVAHEAASLPTVVPERKQRHSSIVSDAQPESYWAGLWSRLGDVENDRNRVMHARTMPGDEYVLQQIWSCLDSQDFAAVAAVCSDWFRLVYHSKLGQRQWQHIVRSRWPQVHGWDGDHAFVSRVCGTTRDWRHRFITLHKLSSNWQHGRLLHQSTIPVELTPTIRCMQFVDQSRLLLLGDSRGGLQMRNLHRDSAPSSMELPAADGVLRAHNYSVTAISSHGDRAVSGSVDGTLSVHALSAFHTSPVPHGHLDAITCVELHQDVVASGSKDATVRLWDLRNVQSGAALVFEHRREAVRMATLSPADATKWLVFYGVRTGR